MYLKRAENSTRHIIQAIKVRKRRDSSAYYDWDGTSAALLRFNMRGPFPTISLNFSPWDMVIFCHPFCPYREPRQSPRFPEMCASERAAEPRHPGLNLAMISKKSPSAKSRFKNWPRLSETFAKIEIAASTKLQLATRTSLVRLGTNSRIAGFLSQTLLAKLLA